MIRVRVWFRVRVAVALKNQITESYTSLRSGKFR